MKIKRKYKLDKRNNNYIRDVYRNILFLRSKEQWLNDKLNFYGVIFLNEILDELGIERKPYGYKYGYLKGDYVLFEFNQNKLIENKKKHPKTATNEIEFEIAGLKNIERTWLEVHHKYFIS